MEISPPTGLDVEAPEAKDNTLSTIGSLDNDALAALAQRSPRSSKYNFFPDFGKSLSCIIVFLNYLLLLFYFITFVDNTMDSNARIAIIQQNMKNLKKTYQTLRTKLASTERQIKKIRRKEREKSEVETKTTTIEATA